MQTTPQEDCLVIVALTRFEVEFRDADPILAEKGWAIAEKIASKHGLEPVDAAMQLEWPSDKE